MRKVVGYNPDGSKRWSENQPSAAHLSGIRGSMVQGEPGWRGLASMKQAAARKAAKRKENPRRGPGNPYATDEERTAARRETWRASAARKKLKAAA